MYKMSKRLSIRCLRYQQTFLLSVEQTLILNLTVIKRFKKYIYYKLVMKIKHQKIK